MAKEETITLKISQEETDLVREASALMGIGHTTFTRQCAIKEARRILNEFSQTEAIN